ncbi:hypothetical protein N9M32_02720 [Alphaproteobacteria bacterium]|nr:hypothetical protein [Alphaproteobacteria bacterium]
MIETTYIRKAKSWSDLDLSLSKLTRNYKAKEAGFVFENIVKYYLKSSPEYVSKIKDVYLLNEVPEKIRLKINLPNSDEGIDLIAVTKEDKIWSIQGK